MKIVDQFHDPAFAILMRQCDRMPELETFVKEASLDTAEASTLPDSAYAWPDERLFPIHTPEQAALSYAYVKVASGIPAEVIGNIKTALDVYGVPESTFEEIKVAAAPAVKDDEWLLPELKLLPVRNKSEVKIAEERLLGQLKKLDYKHRHEAAANLVKKAEQFEVALHPLTTKLAGLTTSNAATTRTWLEARVQAAKDDGFKLAYQTLADELKSSAPDSRGDALLKLAALIGELDEKSGIDKFYDRSLPDPLQTVFNTEKVAGSEVDLGGASVSLSKLASLPASFWEDLGGPELSREIAPGGNVDTAKLASIVETLPLDLKTVIRAQLRV